MFMTPILESCPFLGRVALGAGMKLFTMNRLLSDFESVQHFEIVERLAAGDAGVVAAFFHWPTEDLRYLLERHEDEEYAALRGHLGARSRPVTWARPDTAWAVLSRGDSTAHVRALSIAAELWPCREHGTSLAQADMRALASLTVV